MYGETKKDLVEIIKKLCEMKQVTLIDGKVCIDHVHCNSTETMCFRVYVISEGKKHIAVV